MSVTNLGANLWQDVRFALRQLRRSPVFTLTAVLTLALGIGVTTAIFTLVYQVLLQPIAVTRPGELYKVGKEVRCCVNGDVTVGPWQMFSYDLYRQMRASVLSPNETTALDAGKETVSVRREGKSTPAQAMQVTYVEGNYFEMLGVKPFAGRLLTPADDVDGAAPAVVVSYALWQARFAGDPGLVGSTLLLTGHPVTVVGIGARDFAGANKTDDPVGLWCTLHQEPLFAPERPLLKFPESHWLDVLVRVPDAKAVPVLEQAMTNAIRGWAAVHPRQGSKPLTQADYGRMTAEMAPASTGINNLRDQYGSNLVLLQWTAAFVLLIACANLASLVLVRGMARAQELAVRSAMGASRRRLITQMLVESVVLAMLGGLVSVGVAYGGTKTILSLAMPDAGPGGLVATPSLPVLGFAFLAALGTGLLFGVVPAWFSSRTSPVEALRGANRGTRDTTALPQKALVVVQAALSLMLLSVAGLLLTSLQKMQHKQVNFGVEGRLVVQMDLRAAGVTIDKLPGIYQQIDDNFARLPEVEQLGYATYAPLSSSSWGTGVTLPGGRQTENQGTLMTSVSPHYFDAVGIPLLRGRLIGEHDTATTPHVAVVNETFAKRFFAGQDALGQRFGDSRQNPTEYEIVGIVADARYENADTTDPTQAIVATPLSQTETFPEPEMMAEENGRHFAEQMVVRYRGDSAVAASAVRRTLASIDPNIAILKMQTYQDRFEEGFSRERLVVRLTTLFGMLALVLAGVGLYGVTAYQVARRTAEIGIRMALGATRGGVLQLILRSTLLLVLLGLALGVPMTFLAGHLLRSTLYETGVFQPWVLLGTIGLLLVATAVATVVPARRAASIDPMEALRTQ